MTPDFFIHLTLAVHRVADILSQTEPLAFQLKDSANRLLVSLLLLAEKNPVTPEQKLQVAPRAIREAGILISYLSYAKRTTKVNPGNFIILEREYEKVGSFVRRFHEELTQTQPQRQEWVSVPKPAMAPRPALQPLAKRQVEHSISSRQERILALMRQKDQVQVWELQKVFPEVTKRTLRRDMDDLLQRKLVVRQGEWNQVFYQVRPNSGE